ncbi:leucyl aminopeptidase [Kiloniella laminariae]|uniref:Probable cytosol aminopeptidase n=1 Tax=Kiloniella laminariae TaxID=454162 RepID=A0ABT4LHF2_9PROT|nr:leucyl aminopeptidase [Kiloniella laminariae]MCZ4280380.1 leucyl aminopeptidase [Kiloniella laminariae]
MKFSFISGNVPTTGALVVAVYEGGELSPTAQALDKASGGKILRAIENSRFKGKSGELLDILAPANIDNSRILLAGLGKKSPLKVVDLENLGGRVYKELSGKGETEVCVVIDGLTAEGKDEAVLAAHVSHGSLLRSYRFDTYKTNVKPESMPSLQSMTVHCASPENAQATFEKLEKVAQGVLFTRQLVSEPPNRLYPESFAEQAKELETLGVKVTVLGEAEMADLGMNALLAVGMGSARDSQVVIMEWNGAPESREQKPLAFVGKGVTFDTGGISLKPAAGMEDMKFDMGGAGTVYGLMKALAGRKAKVNVVGACGLAENMPSGNAQRPGDIVTSYSGKTIEVLNTDAEGRLVLADVLSYVQEKHKPRLIIDLATLTGAILVALGNDIAGIFSNNDDISSKLVSAGEAVDERVWRLPLADCYDKLIDSDAADMKNIGGRFAGSITAAQFLQRFIENGTPWVHIDIAGVAWSAKDKPIAEKGATGFGVRLLERFVADNYEA